MTHILGTTDKEIAALRTAMQRSGESSPLRGLWGVCAFCVTTGAGSLAGHVLGCLVLVPAAATALGAATGTFLPAVHDPAVMAASSLIVGGGVASGIYLWRRSGMTPAVRKLNIAVSTGLLLLTTGVNTHFHAREHDFHMMMHAEQIKALKALSPDDPERIRIIDEAKKRGISPEEYLSICGPESRLTPQRPDPSTTSARKNLHGSAPAN